MEPSGISPDLAPFWSTTNLKETAMAFDPVQYKTTTRQQWEDAADAWHRWATK